MLKRFWSHKKWNAEGKCFMFSVHRGMMRTPIMTPASRVVYSKIYRTVPWVVSPHSVEFFSPENTDDG